MTFRISRRSFLKSSALAAASAAVPGAARDITRKIFASDQKLRLGVIGVGNRGRDNLNAVAGEHIAALCDVDTAMLAPARERFPDARVFRDFREMIATMDLDAVVVSTPDHTHAPAAAAALRRGLHVYCEKPLTHTVREARTLTELARKHDCVTQMGTQIHAGSNYRRVVERIRSGAIGQVYEVHVFCDKSWSGGERPTDRPPVPETLDFDLWLGPAPERSYHPAYHPAGWRRWWDFGGGTLADMACHYVDLVHWALDLRTPTAVQATGPAPHPETTPKELIVRWQHPARGGRREVSVTWYDGKARCDRLKDCGLDNWKNGVLFLGEKGWLISDYGRHELGPDESLRNSPAPEPFLGESIGHHAEWIAACKDRRPTTCNFDYAGALTETVLLGNIAFRTGKPLTYHAADVELEGSNEARAMLHKWYRAGWEL